jgi:hypothetical protein
VTDHTVTTFRALCTADSASPVLECPVCRRAVAAGGPQLSSIGSIGVFFAMGLMFFELLRISAFSYWLIVAISGVAWFLLAGFYGDRAFNWLRELWHWFGY